jgi:hypothetical protein
MLVKNAYFEIFRFSLVPYGASLICCIGKRRQKPIFESFSVFGTTFASISLCTVLLFHAKQKALALRKYRALAIAHTMEVVMMQESNQENWHTLHCALKDDLQSEISLTRELLANMRQEEVSLMLQDSNSLNLILQQRSVMLEKLSSIRLRRQETTMKIEKIAKNTALDAILPPNEEISAEILSLSDQLIALNEKMNQQQSHNHRLSEHPDHYLSFQSSQKTRPKRKASIATYQIKK